jgi:hypothetical protein
VGTALFWVRLALAVAGWLWRHPQADGKKESNQIGLAVNSTNFLFFGQKLITPKPNHNKT